MKIEMHPTQALIPYANNPRRNMAAIASVAESIREFGFRNPILVDANMVVINGHTRLAAAKTLGLETVPVVVATDLSEAQTKALRLVDNKTSEIADWDYDLLSTELETIDTLDPSLIALTGFDIETVLDDLIAADLDPISIQPESDPIPKKRSTTLTFGNNKIPLSDNEEQLLAAAYETYVETNRTNMGFVTFLLDQG
jgi:ParB family chromosome partitioning protein